MVAPPDNDVLWARGLTYAHDGSPALQGVSLSVREGEIIAVTGPRGSGKTTLLRCLSGQLRPQRGEVWFNSVPVHTMGPLARERLRRDRFGWIDPEPVLVPELNAWENTALPLMLRGIGSRAAKAAALEWLERLDIRGSARKRPHALPQNERQRVVVARALIAAPAVLFADEPTAPLHRGEHTHVLRTLTTAARSHGITVVLATHDTDTASLADRTLSLLDGRHVRTVHLPSIPEGPLRPEAERRPTTGANRRPAAARGGRLMAEQGGHPHTDGDRRPAVAEGGRPTHEQGGRPTTGETRRAAAAEGARLTAEQAGRTATEPEGRRTTPQPGRPTAQHTGRPAAPQPTRPTTEGGRPPARDGKARPAPEETGRLTAEQAGRTAAPQGSRPAAEEEAGSAADGERPAVSGGGGRAACSLSA